MSTPRPVPVPLENHASKVEGQLFGSILVDAGRLDAADIESILHAQRTRRSRFGEAALALELITAADIEFALARQFGYQYLVRGESKISETLLAAYEPSGPRAEAMRALRDEIVQRWPAGHSHLSLVIVSAARNEGRSFVAANLAAVFAQLGRRTLLIDADMRNPIQHELFDLDGRSGLSALLSGRAGHEAIQRVAGLRNLSVLPAGTRPPNPVDLLAGPQFRLLLDDLSDAADAILIDTPAAVDSADARIASRCAGGALIVARRNSARTHSVLGVIDMMKQAGTAVVGSVLNDF
jgi:receptor protein-tyrosine kinase